MSGRAATRPIEWVAAVGGGLALAGVLVWVLRGDAPEVTASRVDEPRAASVPVTPAPPVLIAPAPAVPVTSPTLDGLRLRGIVQRPGGAAAIIEYADGRQRLVRVGGEVMPGAVLERVGGSSVVVAGLTLGFGEAGAAVAESPPAVAAIAGTTNDYRIGLKARKTGGQTSGYVVADTARLPLLQQAGLRRGDVILRVNGAPLVSEEKVMELPGEVAGSYDVEILYERDGVSRTAKVKVQDRR